MFSQLSDKLQDIFKDLRGHGTISEANINEALRAVRLALLEADVHFQVAKDFIAKVKSKALGQEVLRSITPGQQIVKIFYDELTQLLGGDNEPLNLNKPARQREILPGLRPSARRRWRASPNWAFPLFMMKTGASRMSPPSPNCPSRP